MYLFQFSSDIVFSDIHFNQFHYHVNAFNRLNIALSIIILCSPFERRNKCRNKNIFKGQNAYIFSPHKKKIIIITIIIAWISTLDYNIHSICLFFLRIFQSYFFSGNQTIIFFFVVLVKKYFLLWFFFFFFFYI